MAFSFFFGVAYFVSNGGTEQIATLQLSDEATAFINAEGEFLYEPPGYLSLQVQTSSRVLVPQYDFKPDHGSRVPELPLSTARSDDGTVSAVTQFKDAVFIIDFETGEYWPPSGWSYLRFNPELGDRLLEKLNEDTPGNYTCYLLEELKRQAARRKERLNDSAKTPTPGTDSTK